MQTFWCFMCFWQWHLRCTLVSLAFTPFGCKRFRRPGGRHLFMLWWILLSDWGKLDEHAGNRMVQSTVHNGILATAVLEPHYSCHSRATAGLKRAASENCYFPQPSSWGLRTAIHDHKAVQTWDRYLTLRSFAGIASSALMFLDFWLLRSLFNPSIICWYCQ